MVIEACTVRLIEFEEQHFIKSSNKMQDLKQNREQGKSSSSSSTIRIPYLHDRGRIFISDLESVRNLLSPMYQ